MKATVIKYLRERQQKKAAEEAARAAATGEEPGLHRVQSRAASIHESLYSNRVGFIRRAARRVGFGGKHIKMSNTELQRFGSIQAHHAGQTLARSTSRTAGV